MAKAHTLIDDFNDSATDTSKWSAFASPTTPAAERVREVNGRVELRPRSGDSSGFSGYFSTTTYESDRLLCIRGAGPTAAGVPRRGHRISGEGDREQRDLFQCRGWPAQAF